MIDVGYLKNSRSWLVMKCFNLPWRWGPFLPLTLHRCISLSWWLTAFPTSAFDIPMRGKHRRYVSFFSFHNSRKPPLPCDLEIDHGSSILGGNFSSLRATWGRGEKEIGSQPQVGIRMSTAENLLIPRLSWTHHSAVCQSEKKKAVDAVIYLSIYPSN